MTISTTITAGGRTFTLTGQTTQELAQAGNDLTANLGRLLDHLPPAEPPTCPHGAMVHKTGERDGKPWQGYFCPLPQDRKDERCPPQFVDVAR